MRRISRNKIMSSSLTLALMQTMALSSVVFAAEGERTITLQEDVSHVELITLNVPAGDVEITGTTGNSLTAVVTAVCQREKQKNCNQLLKDLDWSKKNGNVAEFGLSPSGITRYDDVTLKVKFSVPKDKKLEINLSAGELRVQGTSACLVAEVNAGDIKLNLNESQLGSVELNAKVGDVKFITAKGNTIEGERSMLVGAHLNWSKGAGSCHTKASVLAGEVQLMISP